MHLQLIVRNKGYKTHDIGLVT